MTQWIISSSMLIAVVIALRFALRGKISLRLQYALWLPETYRAVMEMKLLLEYSDAEIGKHLGLSETAVSTRVSRGRQMLRWIAEKEGFRYDR